MKSITCDNKNLLLETDKILQIDVLISYAFSLNPIICVVLKNVLVTGWIINSE